MRDMSTMNMASVYRMANQKYHPEFVAFNESDSTVQLFLKVLPGEFLFTRQSDDQFRATISVHTEIIGSYELGKIIDSTTSEFSFELNEKADSKILSAYIPLKITGTFLIHCFITDKKIGRAHV